MEKIVCEKCGSGEFIEKDGYRMCTYCRTKYAVKTQKVAPGPSSIDLQDDVRQLLEKCRRDPKHASLYAGLVLDIDPYNVEALNYL